MKFLIKSALSLLLAAALLCPLCAEAFADTPDTEAAAAESSLSIIDDAALNATVEELLSSYYIEGERKNHISFAYTYLATGDSWYYNADEWFYSASMYKVPMMMILAQKEAQGELSRDSVINDPYMGDFTLEYAEELILVNSNNDYAHAILRYLGGDQAAREQYKQWSPLDNGYYHSDFVMYSFFTARYMNDVMETLYNRREEFPNVTECLLRAMPNDFFHLGLDPSIQVAQKYGAYLEFNSNTGIIYTPNPIILTVMSDCLSYDKAELLIADAAKIFVDYTLSLDAKLEAYEAERLAAEEAEKARMEEEARLKAEQEEKERHEQAEKERLEEQARQEALRTQQELARRERRQRILLIGGGAVLSLTLLLSLLLSAARRRKKLRQAARSHSTRSYGGGRGGDYSPRH